MMSNDNRNVIPWIFLEMSYLEKFLENSAF